MAVEVEDLIAQPFRELINRGNEVIANAEGTRSANPELSRVMLKSARAVVREGERALQRVEPLLLGHLEKYGDAFRDAVKECNDLFECQRQLEEVLYDIDDYVEVDTFDAVKFAQVQAASKAFALCAIESIRRLKISDIPITPISFPPLPPIPSRRRPSRVEPLIISQPGTRNGQYGMEQFMFTPQVTSAPPTGHSRRALSTSVRSSPGQGHMLHRMSSKKSQKSLAPSTSSSDSHYSQASFQWSSPVDGSRGYNSQQPSDVDALGDEIHNLLSEPASPKFAGNRSSMPATTTPWTNAWVHEQLSSAQELSHPETILEHPPKERFSEESRDSDANRRYTMESDTLADMVPHPISHSSKPSRSSMFSTSSSHPSHVRNSSDVSNSDQRTTLLTSAVYDPLEKTSMETNRGTLVSPVFEALHRQSMDRQSQTPVDLLASNPNTASRPAKAKAVEAPVHPKPVWYSREDNCTIGPDSTLHQCRNFCEGALTFQNGRYQEATKTAVFVDTGAAGANTAAFYDFMSSTALELTTNQPVAFGPRKTVTQCINCEFAHAQADFRRDMAKDRRANASSEGVNFRLRFLYKSHLSADTRSSTLYGCIFCARLGYTSREGDATVFTSERQLFRHLSQHPQPLPEVPGVTVLYGYLGNNCVDAENYDLHFPSPQFASPIIPEAPLLTKRPTAVAMQSHLQKGGIKPLADPDGGRDVLQFLAGARIIGVEFPDAWGGKWCTGWHDGIRGAFPAKLVAIEAPPKSDIRLPGAKNDGVVVTARWKWEVKDVNAGWLVFDKHTIITNVSWLSYDSWCWSGMTKDGKVGFFPSSHIKADSIRDPSGSQGSGLTKKDSRRLFKMRHSKSSSTSSSNY
ncbi:hypothetical protein TruAng_004608 [Truncatella angustata]|nr:hypothetical protein TruAng_004608 [Truncatella angustata]